MEIPGSAAFCFVLRARELHGMDEPRIRKVTTIRRDLEERSWSGHVMFRDGQQ